MSAARAPCADSARTARFVMDGEVVCIERPPATMTVLDYLREIGNRRGTKEGCAEGDCGACTVVLGELAADGNRIRYRAVNSCIRFLPTLDGKELVTVESLQTPQSAAHPVQQSMIDHHASQCGFCTPGFVMSLFAMYLNRTAATRDDVIDTLSGNLCRCTGYRPIIEAGMRQWEYPVPSRWSRDDAQSPERINQLSRLSRHGQHQPSLHYAGYYAPLSLDELGRALEAEPDTILLAGGTDIGLWVTKQLRELPKLIYLGEVPELSALQQRADELWIGAGVTLTDAWPALVGLFPTLTEQASRFASPPIRNSATLCGNLANGSPIGDSIPTLIALGAHLELRKGTVTRRLPLEDLYLGYQRKDMVPGEFVTGVAIPAPVEGQRLGSYKLSKRIEQDISAVNAAFCIEVRARTLQNVRLAYGGLAGTACRARHAENALINMGWNAAGVEGAVLALAQDFQPLSDMRASSAYRLRTAGNLLRRFFLESTHEGIALRTSDALAADGAVRADAASLDVDVLGQRAAAE